MSILDKFFQADTPVEPKKKGTKVGATKVKAVSDKAVKPQVKKETSRINWGGDSVLVRPIVTEKSGLLQVENKYVFAVRVEATKLSIAEAVKANYGVRPIDVHVINMPARERKRRTVSGQVSAWKKAIVTLPQGKRITVVEGV